MTPTHPVDGQTPTGEDRVPSSPIYRFYQRLSEGRLPEHVVRFLWMLADPLEVLLEYLTGAQKQSTRHIFGVVAWSINIAASFLANRWIWLWYPISLLVNVMVLAVLQLMLDWDTARKVHMLAVHEARLGDNLLGHKIWDTPKTHDLMDSLKSETKPSKWLLVQFLATEMANRIDRPSQTFELKATWDTYEYSDFLSACMPFCADSIHWLVDVRDFLRDILPAFVAEAVVLYSGIPDAAHARSDAKDLRERLQSLKSSCASILDNCCYRSGAIVQEQCAKCPTEKHVKCPATRLSGGDAKTTHVDRSELWYPLFRCVRAGIASRPSQGDLEQLAERWLRHDGFAIAACLPHLAKFRSVEVPSKKRYIVLLGSPGPSSDEPLLGRLFDHLELAGYKAPTLLERVVAYISSVAPETSPVDGGTRLAVVRWLAGLSAASKKDAIAIRMPTLLPGRLAIELLELALRLFRASCGSDRVDVRLVAADPMTESEDSYYDVGVYDGAFAVESEPRSESSDDRRSRRKVKWEYPIGVGKFAAYFDSELPNATEFENLFKGLPELKRSLEDWGAPKHQ